MKRKNRKAGFTFIEMILTIVIVGIIAGVTAKILLSGIDTYSFIMNRKDAVQHARVGMERMVDELELLRWFDITRMNGNHLGYTDRQGNISSFKSGTLGGQPVLLRGDDFLAGRLGLISFAYLKANGTNATFSWDVKKINVQLTIESLGGYGSIVLRTEVFPRNFMYSNFGTY